MQILVVVGHPNPESFNHALATTVQNALAALGHTVIFHDLCAEGFDPLLPHHEIPKGAALDEVVAQHCAELQASQGLVVVHPNWWGMPPAVLVGWVDRVFRPGVAYGFSEEDHGAGTIEGYLRGRRALVLNTADTAPERERSELGDPLELIWRNCVCGACGISKFQRRTFSVVLLSTPQQRADWLTEAQRLALELFGPVE